jgi:hypothetical protein
MMFNWLILFITFSGLFVVVKSLQNELNLTTNSSISYLKYFRNNSEWWEVELTKDHKLHSRAVYDATIMLRKINNDSRNVHSCYEFKVFRFTDGSLRRTGQFCYPAVIITGYWKCSTTALHALLAQYPGALTTTGSKENCPFNGGHQDRPLQLWFDMLPRTVRPDQFLIDGCLLVDDHAYMRKILREPNTFYIVSKISLFVKLNLSRFVVLDFNSQLCRLVVVCL